MFIITELADSIAIHPQFFGKEGEAAEIELSKKYANKVIRDIGLIVSVHSVDFVEEGFVFTGQGSCHSKARW